MQLIMALTLVDWMAVACVLILIGLFMASDAGTLGQYRRAMAYSMLLLASTMAWIFFTTDAGSVFFGTFTEESEASAKRKKAKQAMHASDKNEAGQDPSGPGDGDGGEGQQMEIALAGYEAPGGGGTAPGAQPKGKRAGGADRDGGMLSATAPEGDGGEPDEVTEEMTSGDDKFKTRKDCAKCPVMALVPAGSLLMGGDPSEPGFRPHEGPIKRVDFEKPFWIGRYEVSRGEYHDFVTATRHRTKKGCVVQYKMRRDYGFDLTGLAQDENHPAICVNWHDAKAYVAWLAKTTGKPYRLPSEAEWEYAARGGERHVYPWGDEITPEDANFAAFIRNTMPVGRYKPNAFGLFDMAGNVWEWVEDCWSANRMTTTANGVAFATPDCRQRVLKGGAWYNTARYLRPAARWANPAAAPGNGIGFRIARGLIERKVAAAPSPAVEPAGATSPTAAIAAPVVIGRPALTPAPRTTKKTAPASAPKRAELPPPIRRLPR